MPSVRVDIYQEENGNCPFIQWTDGLHEDVLEKLSGAVDDLERDGWDLKRPTTEHVRTGIYALQVRYFKDNPEAEARIQEHLKNAQIARDIFELRTKAGLTQQQLADLVGTSASAICRLEDAEYEGHSLSVLQRIAVALGSELQVSFVSQPVGERR